MPIPRYDEESGAIIFTLTEAEKEIAAIKSTANNTSKQNEELLEKFKMISENLESLNKKVSFIEEKLIRYKERGNDGENL